MKSKGFIDKPKKVTQSSVETFTCEHGIINALTPRRNKATCFLCLRKALNGE